MVQDFIHQQYALSGLNLGLEALSPKAMSIGSCQPLGRSAQPKRYAPAWELEKTGKERFWIGQVKYAE